MEDLYLARINVLAQGHNALTPVKFEPAAPRSRVKHSTTEPLRSLCVYSDLMFANTLKIIILTRTVENTQLKGTSCLTG